MYCLKFYVFFLLFSFLFLVNLSAENEVKVVVNGYIQEDVWQTKLLDAFNKNTNPKISIVLHMPIMVNNSANLAVKKSIYSQISIIKDFLLVNNPQSTIKLVGIVDQDIKKYFVEII